MKIFGSRAEKICSELILTEVSSLDHVLVHPTEFPQLPAGSLKVAVADEFEPADLIFEFCRNKMHSFIQKNDGRFQNDFSNLSRIFKNPKLFFTEGARIFFDGQPDDCHRLEINYRIKEDKEELKKQIDAFKEEHLSNSVGENLDAIFEELFMNSVYDAPREAEKLWPDRERSKQDCVLQIFKNDLQLVISCRDPHGALDVPKFIARMNEVYIKGPRNAMNLNTGAGAGLGCVLLFENSQSMFLGCLPGEATVFTCIISMGMSNKTRSMAKKSIHWVQA